MHKSKLYDMAAQIAVDKLAPKPVHITISMQGGGGLSSIELPVIKRVSGGDIGDIGGYTDIEAGVDYDEPATVIQAREPRWFNMPKRAPTPPTRQEKPRRLTPKRRGPEWEPLFPREDEPLPSLPENPLRRDRGIPPLLDLPNLFDKRSEKSPEQRFWDDIGIWRGMGRSPGALGGNPSDYLNPLHPLPPGHMGELVVQQLLADIYGKSYDDEIGEKEFMRGFQHTQEHFNKPFYDRDKEGIDPNPDYDTEEKVIAKIRAGDEDFLTPKEKEVWDRMQGIIGEDDSYLVDPVNKQSLAKILDPRGGKIDVKKMRDRPKYSIERYRKPGYRRPTKAASGGGISSLNENIVYRQGAGRIVTDTWNRIPNFVKQYGKGVVNKALYETTGKTLSDTTREDMTKAEAAALEEAMAEAVVTGKGEFGDIGTSFEDWIDLGEKGNVSRDAEAIVGGATVNWNPKSGQYEINDPYDFPKYSIPGMFYNEVNSINDWLEKRGNTRDQIVDPTGGLGGALLGRMFPDNRAFGIGLGLGSRLVGESKNERYFDEKDRKHKIRHIPYAGAFKTSMGISPQKLQDISEKHDFFGVKDQSLKRTGEGFGGGAEFGLVGGEASGGYSYDPQTDTTFIDEVPIDTTAAFKHGGQTMPRGLSGINDSININGQPHRLVWANPQEERVLKKMGGSGKKVLGKPAYYYGSYGADPWDITEDMTAEDINIGMESGDISTYGMGDTDIDPQAGSDFPTAMSLYDPKEYSKMYEGIDDVYTEAGTERVAPITFAELGATRKENAEQDAGARRRYINQHLANYPGGRRDPVTQELFSADVDYDRAINKYGSSMLETLRDSYAGNQDVFGAMFGHATKLAQDRLREAYNKEIDKFPEDFVDSEEYRESIVDAVLSDPDKAFEKFGLTDVTKSTGLLPEAKVGERGWRDWLGELATPLAVRGLDALAGGIPALLNIWGTAKVNGESVYIKKDGTIIPFTSDTERANIESGSLRGENIVPKKLKRRPVQVASTKEVIEKESTPLEKILEARSKPSSLAQLNEEMQERVNRLYNRNIFT